MIFGLGALLMFVGVIALMYLLFFAVRYDLLGRDSERAKQSTRFYPTAHHGIIALSSMVTVIGQSFINYSHRGNLAEIIIVFGVFLLFMSIVMVFPLGKNSSSGETFPKQRISGFMLSLILYILCFGSLIVLNII